MTCQTPVRIPPREWRVVVVYALLLTALTTLPYLLAWAAQGNNWVFGGSLIGADDGNSYLGKIRLGARGLWDFHLFYTAEEHPGAPLIFLPYILPGQIVGLFVDERNPALTPALMAVFQAMRVVFDMLLVLVIYRFIAEFLRAPSTRLLALVLATLGDGFGWLLSLVGQSHLLGSLPAEFYIPEGFTFIILFSLPHLALARAALLGGFLALFAANRRENWLPHAFLAGLCWLVVGLSVPFYLVIVYCLLGAWGLAVWLRERAFPLDLFVRGLVAAGITLPLFIYYTVTFSTNPAFAQWSAQNLLPSPHPLHYLLAYGVLGVLAYFGGRWAWRRGDRRGLLLVGWMLVVPILVYIPINVQRRMAEAVLVPLAILAAAGARLLARRWAAWRTTTGYRKNGRRIRALVLLAAVPSSLFLLLGGFLGALHHDQPLFHPADEIAALQWLDAHGETDAVVLSSHPTGNLIPAWANLRSYVGHGPETLDAAAKEALVARFYAGELSLAERKSLLASVRYIFYGPLERNPSGAGSWQSGLTLAYDTPDFRIYEVPH